MPYDHTTTLWPNESDSFFRSLTIEPMQQSGPHCVSTVLAIDGANAQIFPRESQYAKPRVWSSALAEFGMKLAYCPTDVRRLKYYLPELIRLDDLFTLSYYSPKDATILEDPDNQGWVCSSHIVILHRDKIIDPQTAEAVDALHHKCGDHFTKRIFRVVPVDCARGL